MRWKYQAYLAQEIEARGTLLLSCSILERDEYTQELNIADPRKNWDEMVMKSDTEN